MKTRKKQYKFMPVLVVAALAGVVGVTTLKLSHAATPQHDFLYIVSASDASSVSPNIKTVQDTVWYAVPQYGKSTVVELSPGQKVDFTPIGGGSETKQYLSNCYIVRAVNSAVNATFWSGSNKVTTSVATNRSGLYQQYCVNFGGNLGGDGYVKNNSGGKLRIYQSIFHIVPTLSS